MPFPQLSGEVQEYVDGDHQKLAEEVRLLRIQVRQMDDALRIQRLKAEAAEAGVRELRVLLDPFRRAIGMIYGEIDQMGIEETTATSQPAANAKWESWKKSMPGRPAEFIDLLLVHGTMSVKQFMVAAKCAQQTVYDTASKMIRAGILEKNSGGRYSLKSL